MYHNLNFSLNCFVLINIHKNANYTKEIISKNDHVSNDQSLSSSLMPSLVV